MGTRRYSRRIAEHVEKLARVLVTTTFLGGRGVSSTFPDLADSFDQSAREYAGRPAIIHRALTLTHVELYKLVRATARQLGPDPGVVGVLTDHHPGTVVALLGILAAGGTYCPIDPSFPARRQLEMLRAAGCEALVAARPGLSAPPGMTAAQLPSAGERSDDRERSDDGGER